MVPLVVLLFSGSPLLPHKPHKIRCKGKEDKDPEEEEAFILFDCEELLAASFVGFGLVGSGFGHSVGDEGIISLG